MRIELIKKNIIIKILQGITINCKLGKLIEDLLNLLNDLIKILLKYKSFTVSEISDFEIVNTALGKKFCRYKGCVNLSEKF